MLNSQRFKKPGAAICFVACLIIVASCDNGIVGTGAMPDPVPTSEGIAQKGPFEIGSNVTIITRPAPDYVATSTSQVQTLDDIGNFEFTFEPDTLYEITVTGRHFNEITGAISQTPMTLNY